MLEFWGERCHCSNVFPWEVCGYQISFCPTYNNADSKKQSVCGWWACPLSRSTEEDDIMKVSSYVPLAELQPFIWFPKQLKSVIIRKDDVATIDMPSFQCFLSLCCCWHQILDLLVNNQTRKSFSLQSADLNFMLQFPGITHQEETPGKTQDSLEGLRLSTGLRMLRIPVGLEEEAGEREVWASQLGQLSHNPTLD